MTVEEHLRAAEFHLTEAFGAMKRPKSLATARMASKRVRVMLMNICALCLDIRKLTAPIKVVR